MAFAMILGVTGAAQAESVTITPAVQQNYEWDHDNFCKEYAIGSELLQVQRPQTIQGLRGRADCGG
jgi:hypothetical protein